jgi:signal transduction histidine kinase
VVRAHGGAITASNGENGGARIVITLPVVQAEQSRPLSPAAAI